MLGMQDMNTEAMTGKLESMLPTIQQVNEQFKDPVSDKILQNMVQNNVKNKNSQLFDHEPPDYYQ